MHQGMKAVATTMIALGVAAGTTLPAAASSPAATDSGARRAAATEPAAGRPAASEPASCKRTVYFTYTKSAKDVTNGRLRLRVRSSTCERTTLGTWRAGSGVETGSCKVGKGWLPNGTYPSKKAMGDSLKKIRYYENHQGIIKGKAWYVGDHYCSNGTKRTELFVHTRSPWPGTSGYRSEGCIKVSPKAANAIASLQSKHGKPTKLYVQKG